MEKSQIKKPLLIVLSIVNGLLILLCLLGLLHGITHTHALTYTIIAVTEMLALVGATIYLAMGFRKQAAKFYYLFMYFLLLTYLIENLSFMFEDGTFNAANFSMFATIVQVIMLGCTILLAFGRNMGKKMSLALCAVLAIGYGGLFIYSFFYSKFESVTDQFSIVILFLTWFTVNVLAGLMTLGKYADKKARGAEV